MLVSAVEQLNRGLQVRDDPTLEGHALMHGLPMYEDNETLASDVAWELVNISRIEHNMPYYPVGHPLHRP
jgi:hypothetical protein